MTTEKREFFCFEELVEFIYKQGFSDHKANMLVDQAIDNYSATNTWYLEIVCVFLLSMPLCLN